MTLPAALDSAGHIYLVEVIVGQDGVVVSGQLSQAGWLGSRPCF
jgi:hypothetical protein